MHSASRNGRRKPYAGERINRCEFIKLGGAERGLRRRRGDEIVFSPFPDPTGSVQKLMGRFNEQNEGGTG